ncbi:hypothetical protein B0920_03305 [Massilia sp. KIM]|nr:hypothetical protein B0920_03305 [Massilia sp. KIM]
MYDDFILPENVAELTSSTGSWNGITVEKHAFTCTGRILFPVQRPMELTWVTAQFEEVGRDCVQARTKPNAPNPVAYKPRSLYIAPAEMEIWAYCRDASYLGGATICFDATAIQERLQICAPAETLNYPRFRFLNDELWTLIKLLSDAIGNSDPTAQLYGDALSAAIAAKLFEQGKVEKRYHCVLSPIQLKDALSYLENAMPAKVELSALAKLAGLSQSHYCRAFKASTGLAPYQWQLRARVDRAKFLLLNTSQCLEEVADSTGFSDAAHFGRIFRKMTGASPVAWRADMLK